MISLGSRKSYHIGRIGFRRAREAFQLHLHQSASLVCSPGNLAVPGLGCIVGEMLDPASVVL